MLTRLVSARSEIWQRHIYLAVSLPLISPISGYGVYGTHASRINAKTAWINATREKLHVHSVLGTYNQLFLGPADPVFVAIPCLS